MGLMVEDRRDGDGDQDVFRTNFVTRSELAST
jgi:hypothetical protein